MNKKPFNYVISPVDGIDITKGKKYKAFSIEEIPNFWYAFIIKDNVGFELRCLSKRCNHIDRKNWKLVK